MTGNHFQPTMYFSLRHSFRTAALCFQLCQSTALFSPFLSNTLFLYSSVLLLYFCLLHSSFSLFCFECTFITTDSGEIFVESFANISAKNGQVLYVTIPTHLETRAIFFFKGYTLVEKLEKLVL